MTRSVSSLAPHPVRLTTWKAGCASIAAPSVAYSPKASLWEYEERYLWLVRNYKATPVDWWAWFSGKEVYCNCDTQWEAFTKMVRLCKMDTILRDRAERRGERYESKLQLK